MAKTLIIGESGTGKSSSIAPNEAAGIKGLDPEKTFLINVSGKNLPSRGWRKYYKEISGTDLSSGNYLNTNQIASLPKLIGAISKKGGIENIVVDDFQYLMSDFFLAKANDVGFDKFNNLAAYVGKIFQAIYEFKGNIFFLTHTETVDTADGRTQYKAKTVGKAIDKYITLEGKFDIVLFTKTEFDHRAKKANYSFITNNDGTYNAKSPAGMFDELYIPNDLGYVVEKIKNYEEGE